MLLADTIPEELSGDEEKAFRLEDDMDERRVMRAWSGCENVPKALEKRERFWISPEVNHAILDEGYN